ncbi:MAG: SDR family NAD(P)-dependent oxidoreductase [Verrucomicrobia bacterium]|nr:SDR family NAD(P)-dependent oxidoreductase [Verrucomicrobiota bacterium]MDE3047202.1 SDR family NAD(P)-dependent oxidoreductase [Verrucomicrobiota bacterium]
MRDSKHWSNRSKTALVTGASSGLGREICKLLQQQGMRLIATGRKNLPEAHAAVTADLRHERHKILELIEKEVPDVVINCAGAGAYGPALDHPLDLLDINANAPIEITLVAARTLLRAKKTGVILNVSSAAGLIPMPYLALYSAAKAALTSFSRSFDAEMRPFDIRILVSLPGQINTDFAFQASKGKYRQEGGMKKEWVAKRIMRQIAHQIPYEVIDGNTKFQIFLAKLLPSLANRLIMKGLRKRF